MLTPDSSEVLRIHFSVRTAENTPGSGASRWVERRMDFVLERHEILKVGVRRVAVNVVQRATHAARQHTLPPTVEIFDFVACPF
jgi:hypothetical protein